MENLDYIYTLADLARIQKDWDLAIDYYIQGYEDDTHTLRLSNFTSNNTTVYDFYWYAIWEDSDGEQQFIERTWLNREL